MGVVGGIKYGVRQQVAIWGQKSDLFVGTRVECKTIFIDAQIQLMKSFVKENEDSWL